MKTLRIEIDCDEKTCGECFLFRHGFGHCAECLKFGDLESRSFGDPNYTRLETCTVMDLSRANTFRHPACLAAQED